MGTGNVEFVVCWGRPQDLSYRTNANWLKLEHSSQIGKEINVMLKRRGNLTWRGSILS